MATVYLDGKHRALPGPVDPMDMVRACLKVLVRTPKPRWDLEASFPEGSLLRALREAPEVSPEDYPKDLFLDLERNLLFLKRDCYEVALSPMIELLFQLESKKQ